MTVKVTNDAKLRFELALQLADDALILGHRLSEWCGHAPMLEEDIALSNLGLDLIGQARAFYDFASALETEVTGQPGRSEDRLAYFREAHEFRNCLLVELENGDFAVTMARQLLYATLMHRYYEALARSTDARFAEIAGKAQKEMAYHVRHASEWVIRLGDGTDESRARMVTAIDELWGYTGELFEMSGGERALAAAGVAPDRKQIMPVWQARIARVFTEATLAMPKPRAMQTGGRRGQHTEQLSHLLTAMQVLARQHPDATW